MTTSTSTTATAAGSISPSHNASHTTIRNPALQLALEQHLNQIPDDEKSAFIQASQQMTDETVLERVKSYDQAHSTKSRFRPQTESLSRFLGVLNRLMAGVATAVQANPNISSIVVGAVRVIIDVAIGFVGFFDKLSEMMCRLGDFLAPLAEYAIASGERPLIHESSVNVYGDLLTFCRCARRVFVDKNGAERKLTSWRAFWRLQWIPFEEEFGQIEADIQHHLKVLDHSAQAMGLNQSLEASRSERDRRNREQGLSISEKVVAQ